MEIEIGKSNAIELELGLSQVYPDLENLNVKPSGVEQIFNHPDSYGYDEITVEAIESDTLNIIPSTETQKYEGLYGTVNVEAINTEEINITPSAEEQTKEGLFNKVTVTGDSNLTSENIKEGVSIFGVDGALQGGGVDEYFEESVSGSDGYLLNKSIKKIPFIDTSGLTSMSYAFRYCTSLEEIPLLDTSNVTNMANAFGECKSLKKIPFLNTTKVTSMSGTFDNCTSLEELPLLDTSNVTSFNSAFRYCVFKKLPQFNTSKAKDMSNAFYYHRTIEEIPLLNFESVTSVYYMFYSCSALTKLGGFKDLGKAFSTTASANYSNYRLELDRAGSLTYESLMNVINNLYDIATKGCNTQRLVLSSKNLSKLTAEEIAIATNKGWTVA